MADTAEGDNDIGVVVAQIGTDDKEPAAPSSEFGGIEAQTGTDDKVPGPSIEIAATTFDTAGFFLSEAFLYTLGMQLGDYWKPLGYELFDGVLPPEKNTTSLLDNIQRSNPNNASDWGPKMLIQWQWKLQQSCNPSNILKKALTKIGRNDLADMVNSPDPKKKRYGNTFDPTVQDYVPTAEYQDIEEMLEKFNLIAVTGPTGHGKTEHVKHYVEKHYDNLQLSVTWRFNANSKDELKKSITPFFESVGQQKTTPDDLKDMLRMIKNEIMGINGKHLLFFDDCAKDICGAIRDIFSKDEHLTSSQIKVIIETQASFINLQHSVEVNGFQEEEAMTLFKKKCSSVNPGHDISDSDSSHIKRLVKLLDKSPSAISIAAYHIATKMEDIKEFIKKIEEGDIAPLLQDFDVNRNTLSCHMLNIESIKDSDECDSYKLLQAIALMGRDPIPIIVLEHIAKKNAGNGKTRPKYAKRMDSVTNLIDIMQKRSMLTVIEKGSNRLLSTHNLIQMATLSLMSDEEKIEILTLLMSALLCYFGKDIRFMDSFRINTLLLPHISRVLKHTEDCEESIQLTIHMKTQQIVLFDTLALTETQNEEYCGALESFGKAYKLLLNLLEIDENEADCQTNSISVLQQFAHEKAWKLFYPAFRRFSKRDDWNVEGFVANTVLNESDKEALKYKEDGDLIASDRLPNFVNKKNYTEFHKKKVALDLAKAKEIFLMEKLAFIQYSYGRLIFQKQIRNRKDFVERKWKFYYGLLLAKAICNIIDEQLHGTGFHIMLGMQVDRSALLYIKIKKRNILEADGSKNVKSDGEWKTNLEDAEQEYQKLKKDNRVMIQHGLVKKTKNDHFHEVVCCRQLAKIYQKLLALDQTSSSIRKRAEDHYKETIVEEKAGYRYPVDTFQAERLGEVINWVKQLDDANTSDEDKETIRQDLEKIKSE